MSAPEPIHPLAGVAKPGRHGDAGEDPVRITLPRRDIVQVAVRRGHAAAVAQLLRGRYGLDLPEVGRATDADAHAAIWIQPGAWMLTAPRGAEGALAGEVARLLAGHAAVIDQSHGRTTIVIEGAQARAVLAKGCRIDLHPSVFGPGHAASTVIAQVNCLIRQLDATPRFEMTVFSTLAEPFFHWLADSAAGSGYEIA